MERENAWKSCNKQTVKEIFGFCEGYKKFISECKTERECTRRSIQMAEEHGYRNLKEIIAAKETIKSGDKVYADNMGKAIVLFNIGKKPIEEGLKILGAHIDSPRLDVKQNPLYEDSDLVLMDTHYYGGIKKYQWTTIPLALHGVVALTDGSVIDVEIGEKEKDPVVCVSDLLIHLAAEQMEKNGAKVVEGEALDLVVGNMPFNPKKDEKNPAKAYILDILKKKYRIAEEDFMSAELEAVPAGKARDLGLDASMVLGYGQDDRVCAYTSLMAMLEVEEPEYTSVCLLVDKEEIGSMGNTGMESHVFDNFIAELLNKLGINRPNLLDKVFCHSKMLSADVDAGLDPIYANVSEKNNASYLGRGIGLNKYTGSRGKSGASDANAEFVAEVRNILEKENIKYQIAELGKVDTGGGGTIAYILANKGIDVIDCGVPVLSMHSPYEVTSKIDLYEAYRAYKAFWLN